MNLLPTSLPDCYLIQPKIYKDNRGFFFEAFNKALLEGKMGTALDFVQDNHSFSTRGVLRGLHFQQAPYAQAKLVRVISGEVMDVVVDLRPDSKTYRQHFKIKLSGQNRHMLYIPRGMAHGFLTLSEEATFLYKCDNYYHNKSERGIRYDDPDLEIDWEYPKESIILSEKDKLLPSLKVWEML